MNTQIISGDVLRLVDDFLSLVMDEHSYDELAIKLQSVIDEARNRALEDAAQEAGRWSCNRPVAEAIRAMKVKV